MYYIVAGEVKNLQRLNWLVSIKLIFCMTSRYRKITFLKRDSAFGVFA